MASVSARAVSKAKRGGLSRAVIAGGLQDVAGGGDAVVQDRPASRALAVGSAVGVESHEVDHIEAVHRVRPLAAPRARYHEGADTGAGQLGHTAGYLLQHD